MVFGVDLKELVLDNFYQPFPDRVFEAAHVQGVRFPLHRRFCTHPPYLRVRFFDAEAVTSSSSLHNVLFGQFEFLATEQAETYLKISVLISHSTYICPSLFDCEELI